jgi:methylated-DNA-[protein]-cysteine S-methyltransferase
LTSTSDAGPSIAGVERVDAPVGRFWFGIDAVGHPVAGFDVLGPPPETVRRAPSSWSLATRLKRHFGGEPDPFADLPLPTGSPFQRACWEAVRSSRPGSRVSYGDLAVLVGRPGAARAVGGAMRRNPAPILVPCHRVVAADGSIGGYAGSWGIGSAETLVKRAILRFESEYANRVQSARSGHR